MNFSDPFGLSPCYDAEGNEIPCPVTAEVGVASGVGGAVRVGPVRGEVQAFNTKIGVDQAGDVTAIWSTGFQLQIGKGASVGAFIEIEI